MYTYVYMHHIQFLQDLTYPYETNTIKDRLIVSDWLIGAAIRLEYGDSGKIYHVYDRNEGTIQPVNNLFSCLLIVETYKTIMGNRTNDEQKLDDSKSNENPLEKIDCK
jgi:hypothetical protein